MVEGCGVANSSPDIGLRLTALGVFSSISLEKLTLESSQWKSLNIIATTLHHPFSSP
jgi:hypothetical protein